MALHNLPLLVLLNFEFFTIPFFRFFLSILRDSSSSYCSPLLILPAVCHGALEIPCYLHVQAKVLSAPSVDKYLFCFESLFNL